MGETSITKAGDSSRMVASATWIAIGTSVGTLALLTSLHVLSPEFDPSWRMVSEYAYGRHGAVLSLMFLAWGIVREGNPIGSPSIDTWQLMNLYPPQLQFWFLVQG